MILSTRRGSAHGNAKLNEAKVREILRDTESTNVALAKKFGVDDATISAVRRRERWAHVVLDEEVDIPDDEKCPECGERLSTAEYCSSCGKFFYDEDEIERRKAEVRAKWSPGEESRRRVGPHAVPVDIEIHATGNGSRRKQKASELNNR